MNRAWVSTKKQIIRVFEAVEAGCETSDMVAAYLGITIPIASAHLSALAKDGLIRAVRRKGERGIRFNKYAVQR